MGHKNIKEEIKMKLRKLGTALLVGTLSFVALSTTVEAVGTDTSTAGITFIEPEDAPPVLDPEDPTQPYEPDPTDPGDPDDSPTGNVGPLTLDYVSSVNFAEHSIESGTEIYQSTTLRPFIQVSDRRGTGEGWNVSATMSVFQNEELENALPGAILTFANGNLITAPNNTTTPPEANSDIVLNAGGDARTVINAELNSGLGSWLTRWFPSENAEGNLNDNVTLEIPAGAATLGDNTAIISWTLTAGPGQ